MPDPLAVRIGRIVERLRCLEDDLVSASDEAAIILRRWGKAHPEYAGIHDLKEEHAGYPDELNEAQRAIQQVNVALDDAASWVVAARNALRCAAQAAKEADSGH